MIGFMFHWPKVIVKREMLAPVTDINLLVEVPFGTQELYRNFTEISSCSIGKTKSCVPKGALNGRKSFGYH